MAHWSKNQPGPQHVVRIRSLGVINFPKNFHVFFFKVESDKNLPHPQIGGIFWILHFVHLFGKTVDDLCDLPFKKAWPKVPHPGEKKRAEKPWNFRNQKGDFASVFSLRNMIPSQIKVFTWTSGMAGDGGFGWLNGRHDFGSDFPTKRTLEQNEGEQLDESNVYCNSCSEFCVCMLHFFCLFMVFKGRRVSRVWYVGGGRILWPPFENPKNARFDSVLNEWRTKKLMDLCPGYTCSMPGSLQYTCII